MHSRGGTAVMVNGINLSYLVTPKYSFVRIDKTSLHKSYTMITTHASFFAGVLRPSDIYGHITIGNDL